MAKKKSLKVNAIMNALLQVMSVIFPLITFPYVSRILLPDGVGKVSFANSVISYFIMFAHLGMPTYGVRACARVGDDKELLSKTAHELLIISVITTTISYGVFLILLFFVPRFYVEKELFLIMSISILLSSLGMEWLYKSVEAYSYITIRSILFKAVALICTILLVKSKEDYLLYGGISIFALVGSNFLNLLNAHKHISFKYIGGYNLKPHLKAVMVFFAMSCATTVYIHLDSAMLGFIKSDEAVGLYDTSVKIRNVLMHIVTALGVVLLPRTSYYVKKGMQEQFLNVVKKALNFVLLFASAITVYFVLFARESVLFLAGESFSGSIIPMQIIIPTLLLVGITNITGTQTLVSLGREKAVLLSVVIGAIVDALLNLILIPFWGGTGAAIGTLFAEIAVMIVQIYLLDSDVRGCFRELYYRDTVVAVVASIVASLGIKFCGFSPFVSLVISSIIYFGTYLGVLLALKNKLADELLKDVIRKITRKGRKGSV
ncbi:MAG: flippase [Lachnospiraceae bacterium]|nr:flippase [Lachnospiraceae bacterium]